MQTAQDDLEWSQRQEMSYGEEHKGKYLIMTQFLADLKHE